MSGRYESGPLTIAALMIGTATVMGATGCVLKWAVPTWSRLGELPYWAVFGWPFVGMAAWVLWAAVSAWTDGSSRAEK